MARDMYDDEINPYDLAHVAAVRRGTLRPVVEGCKNCPYLFSARACTHEYLSEPGKTRVRIVPDITARPDWCPYNPDSPFHSPSGIKRSAAE